jgi:predicted amidophosphoribosyltransferase
MINCERCGKLFSSLSSRLCEECREEEERMLRRAKDELYRNPGLGVMDLVQRLDIPVEVVEKFIREGRLVLRSRESVVLRCEMCGKEITSGKRCSDCEAKLRKMARDIYRETVTREGMYSLRTIKARREEE